jgi:hypothetical protein
MFNDTTYSRGHNLCERKLTPGVGLGDLVVLIYSSVPGWYVDSI